VAGTEAHFTWPPYFGGKMTQLHVQPTQWSALKDITQVAHGLSDEDVTCLSEVRSVLERHNLLDRFGVMLLHKHFDISTEECLLETVDVERRELVVRPIPKLSLPNAVQTQWRLADKSPLQWCEAWCNYSGGTHHHGHQYHITRDR
jgi:hypothetical protein